MNGAALDAFWMPFTPNRQFKASPRLVASAQGIAYRTPDGREVLVEVPPSEYRALRWAIGTLGAKQSRTVAARARVAPLAVAALTPR